MMTNTGQNMSWKSGKSLQIDEFLSDIKDGVDKENIENCSTQ